MRKRAVTTIALYILLACLDGLLTYIATPDLSREGNPLVMYLGLGWAALAAANLLVLALYIWMVWFSMVRYRPTLYTTESFRDYISLLWTGESGKAWHILYRRPKNWGVLFACIGYAAAYALMLGRLILVLEWAADLLGLKGGRYWALRRGLPLGRVDIWVCFIAAVVLALYWLRREYRQNQRRLTAGEAAA